MAPEPQVANPRLRAKDRVKTAERGCARAAQQVFRTRELMLSGPVAFRVDGCHKLVHLLMFRRHSLGLQEQLGCTGKDGYGERGVGKTIFRNKHRIEAFGLLTRGQR